MPFWKILNRLIMKRLHSVSQPCLWLKAGLLSKDACPDMWHLQGETYCSRSAHVLCTENKTLRWCCYNSYWVFLVATTHGCQSEQMITIKSCTISWSQKPHIKVKIVKKQHLFLSVVMTAYACISQCQLRMIQHCFTGKCHMTSH